VFLRSLIWSPIVTGFPLPNTDHFRTSTFDLTPIHLSSHPKIRAWLSASHLSVKLQSLSAPKSNRQLLSQIWFASFYFCDLNRIWLIFILDLQLIDRSLFDPNTDCGVWARRLWLLGKNVFLPNRNFFYQNAESHLSHQFVMAVIYILYLLIYNLTCTEIVDLIYIQRLCQTRLESSIESTGNLRVDSYSLLMLLNTSLYSKLLIKSFCFILVPPIESMVTKPVILSFITLSLLGYGSQSTRTRHWQKTSSSCVQYIWKETTDPLRWTTVVGLVTLVQKMLVAQWLSLQFSPCVLQWLYKKQLANCNMMNS